MSSSRPERPYPRPAARRALPALREKEVTLLDAPDDALAYRRSTAGDERLVLVSLGHTEVEAAKVVVATARRAGPQQLGPHSDSVGGPNTRTRS